MMLLLTTRTTTMVPEHPHFFAHFRCWDLTFKSVPNYLKPAPSIVFSLVNFDGAVVNCYNRTGDRVLLADLLTRKCRRNLNGAMLPGMSAIALTWSKFFANIDSGYSQERKKKHKQT